MALSVDASISVGLIAKPNNYGVTHIAIGMLPKNCPVYKTVLVRNYSGYPKSVYDGDVIAIPLSETTGTYQAVTVLTVDSSGGIVTFEETLNDPLVASDSIETTVQQSVTTTTPVLGSGAVFSYDEVNGLQLVEPGKNYQVNDVVNLNTPAYTTEPNEFGLTGVYHYYDILGEDTATTVNPLTVSATSDAFKNAPTSVYYSVFVNYDVVVYDPVSSTNVVKNKWKKAGETSSVIVRDNGSLNNLLDHVPNFYLYSSDNSADTESRNDLIDFLSVFAFQLDLIKTQASDVFYMTKVDKVDEKLIRLLLKEFGVPTQDVTDLAQARALANNIIKVYKRSGSLVGLQTLIESYFGYGTEVSTGRNLIADYNSSSFEDNTGFWVQGTASASTPVITSNGPVAASPSTVVAFNDGALDYGRTDISVISASCATSSTTVTGTFDSTLKVGGLLTKLSGTGTLATGTVITAIGPNGYATTDANYLAPNQFRISKPPTVALSGANLRTSTNMITGMGKVLGVTSTAKTATFYLGNKRASVVASASSTTSITVVPEVASVDEYLIGDGIPYGTYVTGVTSTTTGQTLTLSNQVTVTAAENILVSRFAAEKIGAQAAKQTVTPGMPYSFSIYLNQGSLTATATATSNITWYDRTGTVISTTSTANNSSFVFNSSTTNTWIPLIVNATAPSNALYAEPSFSIPSVTNTTPWYVDAAQFEGPVKVIYKQRASSGTTAVVTLTTDGQHHFNLTRPGSNSATNYVVVTGLGAPYDGTFALTGVPSRTTFTYTVSSATNESNVSTVGYASSATAYQDSRLVNISVVPNRTNLITNSLFAVTTFWSLSSTSATMATQPSGVSSLQINTPANSTIRLTGVSGTIVGTSVTNTTKPFPVQRSTATEDSYYSFSFYASSNLPESANHTMRARILWYQDVDATTPCTVTLPNGDVIDNTSDGIGKYTYPSEAKLSDLSRLDYLKVYTESSSVPETTGDPDYGRIGRFFVTGKAPSDAVSAKLEIEIVTGSIGALPSVQNIIYGVLFENSFDIQHYFNGLFDGQSYLDDRDSMTEIPSAPNLGKSHLYVNRVENSERLKSIITDGLYYA